MELLVQESQTKTGVEIFQEEEFLRAATPCCGLLWDRNGFEHTCVCGRITVKSFLHRNYHRMKEDNSAQTHGWLMYWTGLLDLTTAVKW